MPDTKNSPPESEIGEIVPEKEDAAASSPPSPEGSAGPGEDSENHEAPTRAGNQNVQAEEFEIQPPPRGANPSPTGSSSLTTVRKGWLSRVFEGKARRESQRQTLQAGYLEMLQMMRSISSNLARQSEMHCTRIEALEQLPEVLKGMESVGRATEEQTKLLGVVQQQLTVNAEQDEKMIGSLNSFNETLGVMDETSRRSSQTIGTLVDHSKESERELRSMLERSEKRLTSMMTMMTFVVLAAAVFGGYIVFQNRALRATIAPIEETTPSVDPEITAPSPIPDADSQPGHTVPEPPAENDEAAGSVKNRQVGSDESIGASKALNLNWRNDPDFQSRVQSAVGGPQPGDPEPKGYKSIFQRVFSFYHRTGAESQDQVPDSERDAG